MDMDGITSTTSDAHYFELTNTDETSMLRARIADATAKAEEALKSTLRAASYAQGMQTTWASDHNVVFNNLFDAKESLKSLLAILKDGE